MGKETFHVHLPDGQRPRKVICKSSHSHKKGNKDKHAIAPEKRYLGVTCLKNKLKFNFFMFLNSAYQIEDDKEQVKMT